MPEIFLGYQFCSHSNNQESLVTKIIIMKKKYIWIEISASDMINPINIANSN